ncbi:serine protease inhibitor dipetalogastin-like isoform X1 [Pieris brassicae]|uniref:serine protease inhibitor dipetalogastin-like isoform X1 n=1 Tax=Pieris brassicae TaxID=7116 RepID=UPI001E65F134|nr:serine protease inhibitor dipetalogastin-like isoform X1 [Pieris brassicae]
MCGCGYVISIFTLLCISLTSGLWQESVRSRVLSEINSIRAGHMLREGNETSQEVKRHCVCSKIYDPVCASNNKSYYNICHMECENEPNTVFVVHQGNCIPF